MRFRAARLARTVRLALLLAPASHAVTDAQAPGSVFESSSFAPTLDPSAEVVLGTGESIEYVGRTVRVHIEGPIDVVHGGTAAPRRSGVLYLRPHDRIVAGDSPGAFSIAPIAVATRTPPPSPMSGRVIAPRALRHDGSDASAVCPYVPSIDSGTGDDQSLVSLRLEGFEGRASLRVVDRAGTVRVERAAEASTTIRVLASRRVAPDDSADVIALEARAGDRIELVAQANGLARAVVPIGGDPGSRCAERPLRLAISVVLADTDALSPAGPTRVAIDENLDAMIDDTASALAACGITVAEAVERRRLAPPPPYRIAIANGDGLPARGGGTIRLRIEHRKVEVTTTEGATPSETAASLARAIDSVGFRARVITLPRIDGAAFPTADVEVRRADGSLARIEALPDEPIATDTRQRIDIGRVDFADGLDEVDVDEAPTGTLEERTLLGAVVDDDPTTIDVIVIERFGDASRTGEAFVPRDGGPYPSVILLDRLAIAWHAGLLTLPHEIGHILMDDAFHPAIANVGRWARTMAASTGDRALDLPRTFTREECDRMRGRGRILLSPR